jgi:hypothetical protein
MPYLSTATWILTLGSSSAVDAASKQLGAERQVRLSMTIALGCELSVLIQINTPSTRMR